MRAHFPEQRLVIEPTSLSGATLPLKDGGSLAFHETEESQAARTTLWTF